MFDFEATAKLKPLFTSHVAPKIAFSNQGRKFAWTGSDDDKLIAGINLNTGDPLSPAELNADDFAVTEKFVARSKQDKLEGRGGHFEAVHRFTRGGLIDILFIHAGAGKEIVFTIYAAGQDWVICTREGYYSASSPAAEKMVGWHVNNGPDQTASFYPFDRFRKKLYRPDVIATWSFRREASPGRAAGCQCLAGRGCELGPSRRSRCRRGPC